MQKFNGELKEVEGKGGAYIEIPFNVEEIYRAKRVKVKATFDGINYRGSIVRMGTECHIIGVTKEIRGKINKKIGETIEVTIEEDKEERVIEIPEILRTLLEKNKEAKNFFEKLSYSNQKKYIQWIDSAKKEETRNKRIETTLTKLYNKEKL